MQVVSLSMKITGNAVEKPFNPTVVSAATVNTAKKEGEETQLASKGSRPGVGHPVRPAWGGRGRRAKICLGCRERPHLKALATGKNSTVPHGTKRCKYRWLLSMSTNFFSKTESRRGLNWLIRSL